MTNKYEITEETHPRHPQLRRIKALRDIPMHGVKAGDYGGWVEREDSLLQLGECWIADNAIVAEYAQVRHDGIVRDNARIIGDARLLNRAKVSGNAILTGGTVKDNGNVKGNARVEYFAEIGGMAIVKDEAHVGGYVQLNGLVVVAGQAVIREHGWFYANQHIDGVAYVQSDSDVLNTTLCMNGSRTATLCRTRKGHQLRIDGWTGTVDELLKMMCSAKWIEPQSERLIELRRPEMHAFIAMCEARIKTWEPIKND